MKKFEVGRQYSMTSICDHECIWTYTVTTRTSKTITITDGEKVQKCRICQKVSEYRGTETVYPPRSVFNGPQPDSLTITGAAPVAPYIQ